jgi:hypothetical protein
MFLGTMYQNGGKYTKTGKNITKSEKILQAGKM